MKAIVGNGPINASVIIGSMSLIFWTITLQTTIKYVIFTLKADNKGEGGIFALYTLVKKARVKWLVFPAIIGGCCIFRKRRRNYYASHFGSFGSGKIRMLPAFY